MNKLSKINESFIDDVIARARDTKIVRKEDELHTIDLGLSVLWSDHDLIINNKDEFLFDEIDGKIDVPGFRLPTSNDVDELFKKSQCSVIHPEKITDDDIICCTCNGKKIYFKDGFKYLESDKSKLTINGCCGFYIRNFKSFFKKDPHSEILADNELIRIRLVKDKEK